MFATATAPSSSSTSTLGRSNLYRQVGVETSVTNATPHQLVAMLYDGLLEAIAQARGSMAQRNAEAKGRAIGRAVRIVEEGLKGSLNTQDGGALATQLKNLYEYVSKRLTEANLRNDDAALAECVNLIQPLREAWTGIAAQVRS
jgi:flagellar protein FliS